MEMSNVTFTLVDTQIIESYKAVLAGFSAYLGDGYEIVLHSLEDLDHSVVAIFNGERTGRQVGAPITDLALQMLARIREENMEDHITYFNCKSGGEMFKSATIVIRGERGRAIGLVCINFDLNLPFSNILENFTQGHAPDSIRPVEILADHSDDLVLSLLEEVRAAVDADPSVSAVNRNKEIVTRLYDKGVFNLKNAVVRVAELLDISKNTVYMHLRNMEKAKRVR